MVCWAGQVSSGLWLVEDLENSGFLMNCLVHGGSVYLGGAELLWAAVEEGVGDDAPQYDCGEQCPPELAFAMMEVKVALVVAQSVGMEPAQEV